MKVMIFGGSGFIGKHLCLYIFNGLSENIYNIDLIEPELSKEYNEYFVSDVRNKINFRYDSNSETVIYNLAAIHKTPGHSDSEYFETNILGAKNVCDFARKNDIKTIVFTSSIAPYGASEAIKYEDTLPMPNTPYGISKLVAEYIHIAWQREDPARKLIIVRPGVVFGKWERGNFTRLYKSMKKGFFFFPGRKDTKKAAIYVKDLVRIMVEMVEKEEPGISLYNTCYPEPHTIEEICKTIAQVTGVREPKLVIPGPFLKTIATIFYYGGKVIGKNPLGFHPDRVRKLMISTNISGKKLVENGYNLEYSLEDAIRDWYNDCGEKGLF